MSRSAWSSYRQMYRIIAKEERVRIAEHLKANYAFSDERIKRILDLDADCYSPTQLLTKRNKYLTESLNNYKRKYASVLACYRADRKILKNLSKRVKE